MDTIVENKLTITYDKNINKCIGIVTKYTIAKELGLNMEDESDMEDILEDEKVVGFTFSYDDTEIEVKFRDEKLIVMGDWCQGVIEIYNMINNVINWVET